MTLPVWKQRRPAGQYGTDDTYRLAAVWLAVCATVADWGGAAGRFREFLPDTVQYTLVDGTLQTDQWPIILADLRTYRRPSDGILLRHVLDNTVEWIPVLTNALIACQQRLVVITFTPDATQTHVVKVKAGYPITHFHPRDLRTAMGPWLRHEEQVHTSHPERVYYLERPCAS